MTKQEFIDELRERLSKLPLTDTEEQIRFYEEMISDRMEEGLSEEEAIEDIGSIDAIYEQVTKDAPKSHLKLDKTKQKVESQRRKKIIILSSTTIIWVPVLIALASAALGIAVSLAAVIISLFVTLWALVASAWAVFAAFALSTPLALLIAILNVLNGNILSGIAILGGAMVVAGLAIFTFFGALYATKGSVILTKKSFVGISKLIHR